MLELTTFMLQHDALPHRNYPRTTGGQKQTNFQHHTNGHLEDTTMWGSLRLAPIIWIMLLLFPVPCVYVKYNNTKLKLWLQLSYPHAENTTIFHHSWSGGWVCWMCIGWSIRVHHFTVCKHFCPTFCYLVKELTITCINTVLLIRYKLP